MSLPKIAVIHPQIKIGGGSEVVALWTIEALKEEFDMTLITLGRVDLDKINKSFHTHLSHTDLKIVEIPIPHLFQNRFDALRGFRLVRFCRENAHKYDIMISTYNVMDFGKRGIQLIADLRFDDHLRRTYHFSPNLYDKWYYRRSHLRTLYLQFGKCLAGESKNGWRKNLTVTNSNWSAKIINEVYGLEAQTIYPPVIGTFPEVLWDQRENGFVCIGRLVPEKGIDRVMNILKKTRARGWDVHLHILGRTEPEDYAKKLHKICQENGDWCFFEGLKLGDQKMRLIAQHKFGLSGCENEAFGIALAEMVKAGCLVWVPNGGGQVEIVDNPDLIYNNEDEAVEKIEGVLKSPVRQFLLRNHLQKHSRRFSLQRFKQEIRNLVFEFLRQQEGKH